MNYKTGKLKSHWCGHDECNCNWITVHLDGHEIYESYWYDGLKNGPEMIKEIREELGELEKKYSILFDPSVYKEDSIWNWEETVLDAKMVEKLAKAMSNSIRRPNISEEILKKIYDG